MSAPTIIICLICAILLIAVFVAYRRSLAIQRLERNALLDRVISQAVKTKNSSTKKKGEAGAFEAKLMAAGIDSTPAEFLSKAAIIFVVAALVLMFALDTFGGPALLGLPLAAAGVAVGVLIALKMSAASRGRRFDEQLTSALPTMAQMLRGGRSFEEALRGVADTSGPPLADELRITARELTYNADPGAALRNLGDRTGSGDIILLSTAVGINAEKGGNLADTVESVGNTIRERASLRRMVKSESASSKASVIAIIGIEAVIYGMCLIGNRTFAEFYFGSVAGILIFGAIIALQVIGVIIMVRMTQVKLD